MDTSDVASEIRDNSPCSEVNPATPPNRDYSQEIAKVQDFLLQIADHFATTVKCRMVGPFVEGFQHLGEIANSFNARDQEHSQEEIIRFISEYLNAVTYNNVQEDFTEVAGVTAELIIGAYDEFFSDLFSEKELQPFSSKYALSADLHAAQMAKIPAIILNQYSSVIATANELEQRRRWLVSNLQVYAAGRRGELDAGSLLRNFGAGALAVANPFVGIPALFLSLSSSAEKDRAAKAQLEQYDALFEEFANKISSWSKQLNTAAKQTKRYVNDKCKEIIVAAFSTIITELAAFGCNLDHALDDTESPIAEELKKEMEEMKERERIWDEMFA